jgi:ATP-binding protein involved in chromosome partitioning
MQTLENVINEISKVNHPAINYSLLKLGIVKDVELADNSVVLTFAFPFPGIPIADRLISSIQEPVEAMGLKLEYIVKIMNEEERATFLQLEGEAWKGL